MPLYIARIGVDDDKGPDGPYQRAELVCTVVADTVEQSEPKLRALLNELRNRGEEAVKDAKSLFLWGIVEMVSPRDAVLWYAAHSVAESGRRIDTDAFSLLGDVTHYTWTDDKAAEGEIEPFMTFET